MDLSELAKLHIAKALVEAGLRLSIVRALTDVNTRTLRKLWKSAHGVSPSNGKLPESVLSFIKSKNSAAKLSAFGAFYTRLHGREITPESMLESWQEFQRLCGAIDINAAYYAVRDARAGIVSLVRCRECRASFIYDPGNRYTRRCAFCGESFMSDD